MHRRGAGGSTQGNQQAQGQSRPHRICSAVVDVTLIMCARAGPAPTAGGFTIGQMPLSRSSYGMKFILMVPTGAASLHLLHELEQRIGQNMQMRALRKDGRSVSIPLMATIIVAVVGAVGILSDDLGLGSDSRGLGNSGMITAAAVSRAGAIEIPSDTNSSETLFVPAARTTATTMRGSV